MQMQARSIAVLQRKPYFLLNFNINWSYHDGLNSHY